MRMRKKKNADKRLAACERLLLTNIEAPMTAPAEVLSMDGAAVFLEIGAGKGGFACGMAERHSDVAYFAMEKVTDCVVIAAEKAAAKGGKISNLRFVIDTADNLTRLFASNTIDRIFLNFSDPWSKKGYAKRRLTHRRYLSVYFNLLKDGGKITFKTDNTALFDFTLDEISAMGVTPDKLTRNLHASEWSEGNIMTEYEKSFSDAGCAINMVEVTKPTGFMPQIPDELRVDRKTYGKEK